MDCIAPEDIGRVSGTVLAKGPQVEQRVIYLYGPELTSQSDCVKIIASVLGKEVKIEERDAESAYKMFTEEESMPPPLAEYLVKQFGKRFPEGVDAAFGTTIDRKHMENVERYSGKKAMTFKEWVENNKAKFLS
ncbi:MAG: hypothetical protein Q9183_006664 [Haloplaca sp. 2 TL-2023]